MGRRALIVDDDPASLRLLRHALTKGGYDVLEAANAAEGLRLVLEQAPPLVITDWNMPGMSGVELCRRIREHEGIGFTYVIIITSHSEMERLVEAFDAGADDFIGKPMNRQELMARVRAGERIIHLEEDVARRTREIHRLNAEAEMANESLADANLKLLMMATTDELTGLINRREAINRLREFWAGSTRYGTPLSCIMVDIDHFKKFNDTFGHAAGDVVLAETARILQSQVRASDVVCRMGGEEFVVFCPHVGLDGGVACAENLRQAIATFTFQHEQHSLKVTISLGVAAFEQGQDSPESLLKHADAALYTSKAEGRNRVTRFTSRLLAHA